MRQGLEPTIENLRDVCHVRRRNISGEWELTGHWFNRAITRKFSVFITWAFIGLGVSANGATVIMVSLQFLGLALVFLGGLSAALIGSALLLLGGRFGFARKPRGARVQDERHSFYRTVVGLIEEDHFAARRACRRGATDEQRDHDGDSENADRAPTPMRMIHDLVY